MDFLLDRSLDRSLDEARRGSIADLLNQNLLDPAQYLPGGWLFGLHSRDSGATVVNESGNVVWAPENRWPEDPSSIRLDITTRTTDSPLAGAPVQEWVVTGVGAVYIFETLSVTPGITYDVRCFVRRTDGGAGNTSEDRFLINDFAAGESSAGVYLTTGDAVGPDGAVFANTAWTDVGDGWWEFVTEWTPTSASSRLEFRIFSADPGHTYELCGEQVSAAEITESWIGYDVFAPRLQHDKDGNPLYYLHEPQATKKAVPSYPGDNTENALLGGESSTSLVGLRTYEWIADTTTASHRVVMDAFVAVSGTTYTRSFYAKEGDYRYVGMWSTQTGSTVVFDLQNGTVARATGSASGEMEECADGVYRCKFTQAAVADSALGGSIWFSNDPNSNYNDSYAGDGTSIGYIAGINAEVGNATSFLPNDGSGEVVRQADRLSTFSASTIGLDGKTEFTSFVEAVPLGDGDAISLLDVVAPSRALGSLSLNYTTGSINFSPRVQVYGDPVSNFELQYVSTGGGSNYGNTLKLAARFKEDDCRAAYNGTLGVADDGASYITPDVDGVGIMRAGNNSAGGRPTDAPVGIRQLRIIPRGLSDSELQNLTS